MAGGAKFGLALIVLGGVTGVGAGGSLAADERSPSAAQNGDVEGVVAAKARRGGARVVISLHGLKGGSKWAVVATRRGCAAPRDAGKVYEARFATRAGAEDAYAVKNVSRDGPLASVKSVRVYRLRDNGSREREACSVRGRGRYAVDIFDQG